MDKINKVTIYLRVLDINETVIFYTTIFDFSEIRYNDKLTRLENTNCILIISEVEKPEIITLGFIIEDTKSIISKIGNYPNIKYVDSVDTAHQIFSILDNSGNTVVLNNSNYKNF